MSNDPACHGQNRAETVIVTNGKLANVFVYVKEGLGNRAFPAPRPVTVEQTNCRYQPHVVGLQTGQTLRFLNGDTTNHNIHAMAEKNEGWNHSQMSGAPPLDSTFSNPEIMLPIKCNQHPWMKMYANVVPHPFFAVTAADGSYAIHGLPPGDYTLGFVHEKFGERTVKISLQPRQQATIDATFQP
jgi:plastocyanin